MISVTRISPVLVVDDVSPCAEFWERLGFERSIEVPHGGVTGFVVLEKEGLEIMYQTAASVRADAAERAEALCVGGSCLFVEVDDLDEAMRATDGAPVVVKARMTSHMLREFCVKDPGGNVIVFGQKM